MPRRVPADRIAIYAESLVELIPLRELVQGQGWSCAGREYVGEEWEELVRHARARQFSAVVARFDDLYWFAPVGDISALKNSIPKRRRPQATPKGSVHGGRRAAEEFAVDLIGRHGPLTVLEITDALMKSGLGVGSRDSVRNVALFALRGSDRLDATYRGGEKRWRLRNVRAAKHPKAQSVATNQPVVAEPLPAAAVRMIARQVADAVVESLLTRPPIELLRVLGRDEEP